MNPRDIKNLRNLLSEEDKKLFDSSYEKISNLFLSQVTNLNMLADDGKKIKNHDQLNTLQNAVVAAKNINVLARKYNYNLVLSETEKELRIEVLKLGFGIIKKDFD
ncbi:unknown [Clostridium sp. CAG:921]|nr:unknown [Clostridium sp. CAG:921]